MGTVLGSARRHHHQHCSTKLQFLLKFSLPTESFLAFPSPLAGLSPKRSPKMLSPTQVFPHDSPIHPERMRTQEIPLNHTSSIQTEDIPTHSNLKCQLYDLLHLSVY